MSQPTNLYDTYDADGLREDVSELIHNISPTETPFLSAIGTTDATNINHQWQTDILEAPDGDNAAVDGEDAALVEPSPTTLVGNYTQIGTKVFGVSGTLEVAAKYGRDSELAYQAAKKARVLKTDVDMGMMGVNEGSAVGDSSTPRRSGSLESWLETNVDLGATGAAGGFSGGTTTARTDGTPRPFSQSQLDGVTQSCWDNGARPDLIFVGSTQKKHFAGFDGVGARRTDAQERTVYATADLYASLFGDMRIVPTRHIRKVITDVATAKDYNVFVIDPEYAKIAYYRPWQQFDLAKSGDSIKREMLVEWTLEVCNEAAHGLIGDLNASGA